MRTDVQRPGFGPMAGFPGTHFPRPDASAARFAALQGLLSRHSVGPRWLIGPVPSTEQLEQAVACALRAPDHGQLVPWRAVLIEEEQRDALGDLFADFAMAVGKPPEEIQRERERAAKGPMLVAWVARITPGIAEVPEHEQWLCAGGALTNFLNAMHLMGFAAKTLSGRKCQHPGVARAFCGEGEQLMAFICVGTPTRPGAARCPDEPAAAWSVWKGSAKL